MFYRLIISAQFGEHVKEIEIIQVLLGMVLFWFVSKCAQYLLWSCRYCKNIKTAKKLYADSQKCNFKFNPVDEALKSKLFYMDVT